MSIDSIFGSGGAVRRAADFDPEGTPRGGKSRTALVIDALPDGQPLGFPALVARGAEAGRTLLATGAVHGDEYEGALAIQDLFAELDPARMAGTFIGIPVVNGPAFNAGTRTGGHDHQDLARIFPGSPDGSPSERVAHALTEYVIPHADLYADLHSAGNDYRIKRFAGYQLRPQFLAAQREAAIAFGFDLVWGTAALPGRSLSAAGAKGVPAIYVEMEGEGRSRPESCAAALQGLRNLLACLGIVAGGYPRQPPRYLIEDDRAGSGHLQLANHAPTSGLFLPAAAVWDRVAAGGRLGVVRRADGRVAAEMRSAAAGRVLMVRTRPKVMAGDCVAYVIEVDEPG